MSYEFHYTNSVNLMTELFVKKKEKKKKHSVYIIINKFAIPVV